MRELLRAARQIAGIMFDVVRAFLPLQRGPKQDDENTPTHRHRRKR